MENKKLVINSAICDARDISEETLKAYESILINAAAVFVTKETKELFSYHKVRINTSEVVELAADIELMIQNGTYVISEGTVLSRPVALIVNGTLDIKKNSKEALNQFVSIIVNGMVTYPSDMKNQLPPIKVNGTTECYPGDAILLSNKLILDKVFLLKAKNSKYYVRNKVVIADHTLDITKLVEKGTTFVTKRAFIVESLLEKAIPLFDDNVEIKIIPDGYAYISEKQLDDTLLQRYGNKLYIDNDLIITLDSANALKCLTGVMVNGMVLIVEKLLETFHSITAEYSKLRTIKGKLIEDRGTLTIDQNMLLTQEDGITVSDCGIVFLQADIKAQDIEEKLQFIDCGCVCCDSKQRSAVELVSEEVGHIDSNGINGMSDLNEGPENQLLNNDTITINAASYKM